MCRSSRAAVVMAACLVACLPACGSAGDQIGPGQHPDAAVDVAGPDAAGAPCGDDSDCPADYTCVYAIADGCAAKPTCQVKPTDPCLIIIAFCGCDGKIVGVGCEQPSGYAPAPVSAQQGGTCPAASGTWP